MYFVKSSNFVVSCKIVSLRVVFLKIVHVIVFLNFAYVGCFFVAYNFHDIKLRVFNFRSLCMVSHNHKYQA